MLLPYSKEEYKLGQFLLKKIKLYYTSRKENETRKERVYNNVKIFRCMYLYTNRFLRNNTKPIENMNKMKEMKEQISRWPGIRNEIKYETQLINVH